jgi:ribulose 1,5-bisphosphate synthetase/thiazole synthase
VEVNREESAGGGGARGGEIMESDRRVESEKEELEAEFQFRLREDPIQLIVRHGMT